MTYPTHGSTHDHAPASETPVRLWPFSHRAAIFDFDGTLADSIGVWRRVDEIFFARRSLTVQPGYAHMLAVLGFQAGARYTIDTYGLPDTVDEVCAEWNELGRSLYRTDVEMRPGALDYVRSLKAHGIPVGIATTNAPEVIEALGEKVDLDALIPVRVHGCDVARATKDYPDIFLESARRLGVEARGCVVFEDNVVAIETARSIGMATVGLVNGSPDQDVARMRSLCDIVLTGWEDVARTV